MTDVDEFARGESMHARPMPQSFVRPVSLDKVREHSSSRTICGSDVKAEQMSSQHTERSKALTVQSQNDQLYHRMLERKLAAEGDSRNRKPHFVRLEDRSKQLYDDHAQRQRKRQELAKKYNVGGCRLQDEKLKECTFQPEVMLHSDRRSKRTLEEFLNSQKEHCRKTADRINVMKTELDREKTKEATFQPRINKLVQNIASSSSTCSVHERLYEKSKQKLTNEQMRQEKENIEQRELAQEAILRAQIRKPSAPQVENLTRHGLLNNASSQSLGVKNSADCRRREESSGKKQDHMVSTSLASQRILIHKLMKEMCHHCHSLGIRIDRISYLQLGDIMSLMNFVKEDSGGGLNERRHLFEIWQLLRGEANQFVTLHSLLKVVCSIVGIHNMKLVEKEVEDSDHQIFKHNNLQLYAPPTKGKPVYQPPPLVIDEKESKHIRKVFEMLYITRLNHEDHSKRTAPEESSFRPEISETSKELAERHRIRILQETSQLIRNRQIDFSIPENGEISHADLLLIQKKTYEAKAKEKKQLKEEQEQEASTMRSDKPPAENSTRYLELYDLSKAKAARRDRTADQIQVQRYRHELTFKPNTSREKTDSWQPVAKDIDKAIYRMYEGRRLKDEKYGCSKAVEKSEPVERIPLLYLNVNIDNAHSQRLSVYENDDPSVLAEQFGSRFKLSHQAKMRLCELIRSEIRELLCKIPR